MKLIKVENQILFIKKHKEMPSKFNFNKKGSKNTSSNSQTQNSKYSNKKLDNFKFSGLSKLLIDYNQ